MYLLYPITVGGYAIFQIPPGQTADELATSFGLTMAQCAEFDLASFSPACASFPYCFTLVDNQPLPNDAAFDLPAAKVTASTQAKSETSTQQQTVLAGYTPEVLAAQATLPELSRTPEIQASIAAVNDLNTTLQANLTAIAAATTIDEVNNVVNPPTGTISTSRTGNDFNDSFYITFFSASLAEDDTELFIPATSTVVPYILPAQFAGTSEAFGGGNYTVQIRETSTGRVLAEFICPEGAPQTVSF